MKHQDECRVCKRLITSVGKGKQIIQFAEGNYCSKYCKLFDKQGLKIIGLRLIFLVKRVVMLLL